MECYYTRSYLLRSFLILPFTFCLFALSSLQAQTLFVGADGGDWFTATNWNNGLPALGNDATVPSGKTVVISQALNVNFNIQSFGGIKNTAALTLATNLVSGGLITNTGTLTINAGITLTSSGGIINSGTITNNGTCNSNSVFTNAIGSIVNNAGSWNQQAAFTNSGIFNANAGTFTCPQVFTNNAAVNVLASAAFKVDFGGAFTNATGSTLLNAGAFGNLGTFLNTTTVTNTGTFTNNSSHTCNGVFNNESGGTLTTTSTLDINGRINNKVGGTVNNSFNCNVKAAGFFDNAGAFTNANAITISLGGTFCNEATGVVTTNFGSSIVDGGYLKNIAGGQIAGNGSLTTTKKFDNFGLFDAQGGSQITIGDTLNNTGTFKSINIFTNNGYIFSTGSLQNLSGGTWINNKTLVNQKPGVFTNGFEYDNKSGATTTNNGTFINNVRLYNDGDFTNNAYLLAVGDFYNRVGGTLTNTEVVEVNQGSIVNDGTVTNTKSVYLDQCSVLSNRATVNNNGNIISSALIFQRGTVSGNAINKVSGFIQTAAGSAAPICRASLSTGTDLTGAAKVYGQNPVLPNLGIDSCAGFQYFIENTTRKVFTCAQVGTIVTGHFTLLVRTGDSLTCTLPITIFDGVAPIFTNCPSDVTVLSVNNTEKYSWPTITATDNCLGAVSIVSTIVSGSSFNLGATNVVVTAKDASNNARDCRFMVTVVQTLPATSVQLTFANCPANISVTVASGAAVATWSEPTVTGSAYPITITKTNGSGSLFGAGVTTVTYTATDANAKVATCIFTVTVTAGDICSNDNINPVIQNCPANIFLVTNPIITSAVAIWKSPTASDNCGNVTLISNYTSGTIFPIGTQTVVYTATDAKNNTATCTFTINQGAVNPCAGDVTGPTVANCPANITQNVSGLTAPVSWTPPTANDNCSPIITNASAQPGDNFVVGTTPVRYQFSDKVGNLSTCAFNVTLVNACLIDTIAPVLGACPANITVSATGTTAIVTFTNPTATDNCSTPTVIATPASGSSFLVGTTTVTETATDAKGNSKKCTFTVTVSANPCANDIVPPVLGACPANITVNAIGTSALATWTNPTATDNCSTPTVVSAPLPGSSFNVGTTTVTETATDAKGNKSTCTFTVTVTANPCANDIVPPVLGACPANITVNAIGTSALATWTNPTATDNCSTPTVVSAPLPGSSFNVGTTTVTETATDAKGNKSTCTFTVTVTANPCANDIVPPVLGACPANITVNAIVTSALATWTNPTATDNCSTPTVVSAPLPGSSFNVGTTTVTETATDAKGNKSTCTFTVTVIANPCANDIVPPVLSACPANIIVQVAGVGNQAVVTFANPTATDNCSAPSVVSSPLSGSSFNIGTTTVTVTATDAKGNTSKCTFTVTVNAPVNNCTAPPTPKGWISLGSYGKNFYFKYLGGDATLEQAEDLAKKIGGHLPVVHDAAQNSFLKTIATQSIWLGLERDCNGWETPTEAQATYFNWASGEPNNYSGNENAVQMYPSGFWNDISENAYNCTIAELKCAGEPTCQSIKGSILNETWTNISGNLISDLTDNPNYPKNATSQKQLTSFKLAYNEIPNMGNRARGFIYPPQTGNYVFTVYGDDQTDLYLSPDNILGHKKLICNVNSWTNEGELTREANQISQTIYLEGGKEYYIELLNKQGYGGNSFGVLWKLPNTTNSVIVSGNYLAPYYQCTHTPTERCVTDFDAQKLYKIINKNSGKCLDVFSAATTNNASVGQWDYWGGSNQKWSIVATSGGYVKLVAQHSGKVLGCNNNSSTSVLTQNDYVNGGSSEWKIKCADGGYTLTHRASREKCDITNSSTSNGAFAQLFDDNGTDTQIFQIVEVSSGNGNYLQNTKVLTLTAASEANRTRIEWINNTGAVNDFFQVEKMNSSTGAFEKIGAVTSKSTDALENYVSYDMNPTVGDNFYRIAAFYRDGSNNYSEVEKVIFAGLAGNIFVYPNPTDEVLNIDLTRYKGASVDVFMYNSIGQIAHAQRIENLLDGFLQVDISDKQVGNYCLRIVSKGKRDETKSFIIAR